MDFETILFDKRDGVATLTLDRPERHNGFTVTMAVELREAWAAVRVDPEGVCVTVTGAGEHAFRTGMDVAEVADASAREAARGIEEQEGRAFRHHLTAVQNRCWKPVATAVNGMCRGGLHEGLERTWHVIQQHTAQPDPEQGSRAFVEKRKPRWAPYTGS